MVQFTTGEDPVVFTPLLDESPRSRQLEARLARLEMRVEALEQPEANNVPNMYRFLALKDCSKMKPDTIIAQACLVTFCAVLQILVPLKLIIDFTSKYGFHGWTAKMEFNYALWYGSVSLLVVFFMLQTLRYLQMEIREASLLFSLGSSLRKPWLVVVSLFINMLSSLACPIAMIVYVSSTPSFLDIVLNVMGLLWIARLDEQLFHAFATNDDYELIIEQRQDASQMRKKTEWQKATHRYLNVISYICAWVVYVMGFCGIVFVYFGDLDCVDPDGNIKILEAGPYGGPVGC